ncbi:phosphatase PAP2 family protein [Micromonospora sp. AMSO31t]|uniref:phosphatase PAP2 family protein n=1 Tax=Micromonospora sp. AMSO31t TaxID=2650566 RepID=UPI00124B3CFC|nr:phosphatase PAP2 family protein [Micromonospora sp. AMSO31t]KAB1916281.1 phosphatase PAP2 family protein [Micromonospora sp. AMSO31t]
MTERSWRHYPAGTRAAVLLLGRPAAAFLLLALLVASPAGPVPRLDAWVSRAAYAAAVAHPLWRASMAAVTVTGSTAVLGPLTALGCVVLLVSGRWRQAVFTALAMTATVCLRLVVLAIVARPRPVDRLAPASSYSFPSGHTTASAAAALILVVVCWPLLRLRRSRILLAVAAGGWALSVGVSRVALVVHWPSDIVGAWLFALVTVLGTATVLRVALGRDGPEVTAGRSRRQAG